MLIGKQISGLLLLFGFKRVCCHFGARHNDDLNLIGTESECANRLRSKLILRYFIRTPSTA